MSTENTKDQRTANMVHFPNKDATDPHALDEYLDALVVGSGAVQITGTPVDEQLAVWTSATNIKGDANLTWDGATLELDGTLFTNQDDYATSMLTSYIGSLASSPSVAAVNVASDYGHVTLAYGNTSFAAWNTIFKSRTTDGTTFATVADGDEIWRLNMVADDGTQWRDCGIMRYRVDGTPGSNDIPTRFEVYTGAGSTATLALTIDSSQDATFAGDITVSGTSYTDVIQVNNGTTVAGLPTGVVGKIARVTDASGPSVGSTVTGGGAAAALVWYNGSNWTVIGV